LFKINTAALRNHCIAKYGETMGVIAYDMELKVQTEKLGRYNDLHRQRDDAVAECARREASLPSLAPLRVRMDAAYAKWLAACDALENQRVANAGAVSDVQTKIIDLNAAIAQCMSAVRIDPWKKSDLFATPEVPPSLHESSMRFEGRVGELKMEGYSTADAQRIAREDLGVNKAGVPA
jgi:hypothetical protein